MSLGSSQRWAALTLLVLLVVVSGGVYWLYFKKSPPAPLPGRGSLAYLKYVEAFQLGVAVLDVGKPQEKPGGAKAEDAALGNLAESKLTEATQTIPEEPAGWADLGLWYLRENRLDEAARTLRRAQDLAPDSAAVQRLLGLLDKKNGKFDAAEEHFRKAYRDDPKDLRTLWALKEVIAQGSKEGSDREILKLLDEGLAVQPTNLILLQEKVVLAAQLGDRNALDQAVAAYARLAPTWSGIGAAEARAKLQELERQVRGPLPDDVPLTARFLDNNLKAERVYSRDANQVAPDTRNEGEPVEQFLRLEPMRSSPSPPDLELTFDAPAPPTGVTEAVGRARWDVALPVWLTQDAAPTLFVANANEVRAANRDAPPLPFPGGAKAVPPTAHGVVAVDWDNDYRSDLFFAGAGGLRFFQQGKDGTFTDVTGKTKLDQATLAGDYFGAWAADVEMDGDLDLVLAPRAGEPVVLRNNGDGTFKVVRPFPGVAGVRAFAWADLDHDGAPDAAFLDAQGKLHVFTNERSGLFRTRPLPNGLGRYLALTAADVNDDGVLDLVALRDDGVVQRISDKDKGGGWEVAELARWPQFPAGLEPGSCRLFAADLDNNGGIDLLAATPSGARAWLCDEQGHFTPLKDPIPERVFGAVDVTGDGRLDLLAVSEAGRPVQRVNRGQKDYRWQVIRFHAEDRRKVDIQPYDLVNSFGIGGEIEVRSGLLIQTQPITAPVVHFGLGEQPRTAVARIVWPNGGAQGEFDITADQTVSLPQRLFGSCPFLFTDDGRGLCFVADFMWSTPLGMYVNGQGKGGFLRTEEWLKVRGDQLVPRNGFYDVRVTAELWETDFFDHLSMIVVDHPADTEVFVDERFAVAPLPLAVHVTAPPRPVARAGDDRAKDVTDVVRAIDGKYLDTFGRGRFRGVTRDHYVEVDLGDDAPTEGPLWLLATGWIQPTDSSLNVALEQGSHDPPRPVVLEVPDGKGGWKVGRDDVGFPAGKNKTLLIRLDGIGGDARVARRFRLRTNMEVYWDALRYARGLDGGLARQQRLNPDTAELRPRGISLITRADASSPEIPHYDRLVSTVQVWRDLIGYYTRYGDVRELLAATDDRYVIMNAGDEIVLKFRAPEGPPPGWKRDFVWISDGWTKDGNLNTRFSKTVLPLPAHDLTSYDRPPGRLEDDPVYRRFPEDWRTYHTRYVTPDVFEQGLRSFRRPRP
jgi:tetratricopeptide (TPR) repeat protein